MRATVLILKDSSMKLAVPHWKEREPAYDEPISAVERHKLLRRYYRHELTSCQDPSIFIPYPTPHRLHGHIELPVRGMFTVRNVPFRIRWV